MCTQTLSRGGHGTPVGFINDKIRIVNYFLLLLPMVLTENSRVRLHTLHISQQPVDGIHFSAVRWDSDDSILVGLEAVCKLHQFYRPRIIKEIIDKSDYGSKEIISFLQQLIELNYVKEIDGISVPENNSKIKL